MDIKTNPKLVGKKFLQKFYSTPAMDEIVLRKISVTIYHTTRKHNCEKANFVIRNVI